MDPRRNIAGSYCNCSGRQLGPLLKVAYHFGRRHLGKLAGRQPERMLEPMELFAHVPKLLRSYGQLEQATAKLHAVDKRLMNLAELKAATLTQCLSA
ncbi:MAG: hypothetical protein WKF82_10900 [Nocardioidaceae bacterium]